METNRLRASFALPSPASTLPGNWKRCPLSFGNLVNRPETSITAKPPFVCSVVSVNPVCEAAACWTFTVEIANVLGEREGPKGAEESLMKTRIWQRLTATLLLAAVTSIGLAADNEEQKPAAAPDDTKPAVTVTVPNPAPTSPAPAPVVPPKLSLPPL